MVNVDTNSTNNTKNAKRQIVGRRNKAAGDLFEKWIISACDYYFGEGIACIQKTPEPVRVLSHLDNKGRFMACFIKQAQPDFKGCLMDGSCIIFDVKHTENDRINQSVVTTEQEEILDKYEKMGARCFIIVSLGMQDFYRIPWNIWKNMKEMFGHKYMAKDTELIPYKVPDTSCIILFLEGIVLNDTNDSSNT